MKKLFVFLCFACLTAFCLTVTVPKVSGDVPSNCDGMFCLTIGSTEYCLEGGDPKDVCKGCCPDVPPPDPSE